MEPLLSPRVLLSLTLGDAPHMTVPPDLLPSWAVCAVNDVAAARQALHRHLYRVGLLLLKSANNADPTEVAALLEDHQSIQWVGVFPAEVINLPAYRTLILQHLFDFHTWPIDTSRLCHALGHAYGFADLSGPCAGVSAEKHDMALVGQSKAIRDLRRQIIKVARADAPVMIVGESGSGKELTAQAIHQHSSRAGGPFIALNCGAIPASLIQSELFGYERGAFTGAVKDRKGLIESAVGGTIFLDEIGDVPFDLQANLLRFLEERTINRVGSARSIKVDVRVIAATHVCLEDAVNAGRFREDLLYRLNVLPLTVPALRERKEDLEFLVNFFFQEFASEKRAQIKGFSQRAMATMHAHNWPGNVRELINRVRRAMVMSEGRLITPEDLGLPLAAGLRNGEALGDARVRAEWQTIHECLQDSGNNVTHAARHLGVSRTTLYRLMEKHGISP